MVSSSGDAPDFQEAFPRMPPRSRAAALMDRIWNTAVFWSWLFNGLRLGSFLLLLPLLTKLPAADFGFYYLLLSIVAITPFIDLGFAGSVERNVSYATAGAQRLSSKGLPEGAIPGQGPNYDLIWRLVHASRAFYRTLTLFLVISLGAAGTVIVSRSAWETTNPTFAWIAWGLALLNAAFEVYSSWWNVVLRGMNRVVDGNKILCLGYAIKLFLSVGLLAMGAGVPSIFAAGLLASAIIRFLSRRSALRILPPEPVTSISRSELISMLKMLWPNSWRVGLQLISSYLTALALMLLCKTWFGLGSAGQYGFSLNIVAVIQAMSSVWVTVKWPLIGQLRSQNDMAGIRKVFWSRIWLETVTFIVLAIAAIVLTPFAIKIGGINKNVLPSPWFVVLLINTFLETQMILWGTYLTTENRVPTLWPIFITNIINLGLVSVLAAKTDIALGAFALGPLIGGLLFNYWFWPFRAAQRMGSSWFAFMFKTRPEPMAASFAKSL